MKEHLADPRYVNRSEVIREVCNVDPSRSNKEIREEVFRRYGLRVGGNLVVAAVGTRESRVRRSKNWPRLIEVARRFYEDMGVNSVEDCLFWLRAAAPR